MKLLIIIKSLLLISAISYAQDDAFYFFPESLKKGYEEEKKMAEELSSKIKMPSEVFPEQLQAFFKFNDQLLKAGQEEQDPNKIYLHYINKFRLYAYALNDLDKGLSVLAKARAFAESQKNIESTLYFLRHQGVLLDKKGLVDTAMDSFWVALNKSIDANLPIAEASFNLNIAYGLVHYVKNETAIDKAIILYKKSLKIYEKYGLEKAILMVKFNLFQAQKNYKGAIKLIQEFLASENKHSSIYDYYSLSLAKAYKADRKIDKAKKIYLDILDRLTQKRKFNNTFFKCLHYLQELVVEEKDQVAQLKYAQQLYDVSQKNNNYAYQIKSAKMLSDYYETIHDFGKALAFLKLKKEAEIKALGDSNDTHNKIYSYFFKLKEVELNNSLLSKDIAISEHKNRLYFLSLGFLILLLSSISSVLLMRTIFNKQLQLKNKTIESQLSFHEIQAIKLRQANEKIGLQNVQLEEDLTQKMLFLAHKNELLSQLNLLIKNTNTENIMKNLKGILRQNKEEIDWQQLNLQFQQSNKDFFKTLAQNHPNLTQNELLLCAYLKMNMNTKDIAALTFKTVNSIKMARSRLRKKLNLTKRNLAVYLNSIG